LIQINLIQINARGRNHRDTTPASLDLTQITGMWVYKVCTSRKKGAKILVAITCALMVVAAPDLVRPQQSSPQQKEQTATAQETPTLRKSSAIEITVETFRKQIVPGTRMGVTADITNKSDGPVYLRQRDVQLVLPADVDTRRLGSTEGWFPTEYDEPRAISLRPNETYRVFFDRSSSEQQQQEQQLSGTLRDIRQWFQYISFTPGTYPITVEAKYWEHNKFDRTDYHTAVETKTLEFVAPQSIILLGAAVGGFIFALISWVRSQERSMHGAASGRLRLAKATKTIAAFVGSILLSVIVIILLGRIAETQFFVKVTVSDFWGAIAVGFLANYGGWALLDKMVPAKK
jgi:hypothetical protein